MIQCLAAISVCSEPAICVVSPRACAVDQEPTRERLAKETGEVHDAAAGEATAEEALP